MQSACKGATRCAPLAVQKTLNRKIFEDFELSAEAASSSCKQLQAAAGAGWSSGTEAGMQHGRIKFMLPALARWTAKPNLSLSALRNLRSAALPLPANSAAPAAVEGSAVRLNLSGL